VSLEFANQKAKVWARKGHWRLFPHRLCLILVDVENYQRCTDSSNKLWKWSPFLRCYDYVDAAIVQKMPSIEEKLGTLFVHWWVFHVRDNIIKYNQHVPTIPLIALLYLLEYPTAIKVPSPVVLVLNYGNFVVRENVVFCWADK